MRTVTFDYEGLECVVDVVTGDWEGDPGVPGGINYMPDYGEIVSVKCWSHGVHTTEKIDITELLSDSTLDAIEEYAISVE